MTPTIEEIDAAMTFRGGWTRETLAQWGVPWPPPKGWKRKLLASADTHRNGGDAKQAPLVSGAVGSEADETPQ